MIFSKLFILSAMLIVMAAPKVQAFDYQKEIEKAQAKFGNFKDYPIVIFDQDEIDWQLLTQKAYGDSKEAKAKRIKIIQDYVFERSQMRLSEEDAEKFEVYITDLKDSALALPLVKGDWHNKVFKICAVFSASPNTNKRIEHERLLGLLTDKVYGQIGYELLNSRMEYDELAMFSLYHEISHCLDTTYMIENYQGHEEPYNVHLSESFAEGMAYMLLRQMGYEGMANKRARIRMTYSRMMGEYFARNPRLGFGNPFFTKGGVIYHLAPAIRGAQIYLQTKRYELKDMSVEQLIEAMTQITADYALDSRAFYAISKYLEAPDDQKEEVVEVYRDRAYETPELFYAAYKAMIEYRDYTEYVVDRIFDINPLGKIKKQASSLTQIDLESFDYFCKAYKDADKKAFLEKLYEFRSLLRSERQAVESQRSLAKELNALAQTMASDCDRREQELN